MISPDTPSGTQVACIRNGPVGNLCGDIPLPTVGCYYTIDSILRTGITPVTPVQSYAVYLQEIPQHYVVHDGIIHHVGYELSWFRPLDKWVCRMEDTDIKIDANGGILVPDAVDYIIDLVMDLLAKESSKRES